MIRTEEQVSQENINNEMHQYAESLKSKAYSKAFVVDALMSNGVHWDEAKQIVNDVYQKKEATSEKAVKHIISGGLMAVIGVAVTIVSYFGGSTEDTYMITYGAIAWGVIHGLYGFYRFLKTIH